MRGETRWGSAATEFKRLLSEKKALTEFLWSPTGDKALRGSDRYKVVHEALGSHIFWACLEELESIISPIVEHQNNRYITSEASSRL